MAQTKPGRIINLAPLAQAFAATRQRLYQPPNTTISSNNPSAWPAASQPVRPVGPQNSEPIAWQFPFGQNLQYTPWPDAQYDAEDLKNLATYVPARFCIQNIKEQIVSLEWTIQARPLAGESEKDHKKRTAKDPNIKVITEFLERPNPDNDWDDVVKLLIEDVLVIDAGNALMRRTNAGKIAEIRPLPGETITQYITDLGYRPTPPDPAYAQLWQGVPRVNLDTDQLLYRPNNIVRRNTISSNLYGMSPTEVLAPELQIGINRLAFVANFYTSGSIPEGLMVVPKDVNPQQITRANDLLNGQLAGNLAARRGLRFVQGFTEKGDDKIYWPKAAPLADFFDELHLRKIAFGYGVSPQRLTKQMNRASAESAEEAAEEEGLFPYMRWLKRFVNHIIQRYMQMPGYEFVFDDRREQDLLKRAQANEILIKEGIYTRNEIREDNGDDVRPEAEADMLTITTPQGVIPLEGAADRAKALLVPRNGEPQPVDDGKPSSSAPKPKTKPAAGETKSAPGKTISKSARATAEHFLPSSEQAHRTLDATVKQMFQAQLGACKAALQDRWSEATAKAANPLKPPSEDEIFEALAAAVGGVVDEDTVDDIDRALGDAVLAGAAQGMLDVGVTDRALISQANQLAQQWAKKRAAELVGKKWVDGELVDNSRAKWAISDTTRDIIRDEIQTALGKETWMHDLIASLEESTAFSSSRAEMVARTEVSRAQVTGTLEAWKKTGVVKTVSWHNSVDDPCDECVGNAEAGEVELGRQFPDGSIAPPAHPRCRCSLLPGKIS